MKQLCTFNNAIWKGQYLEKIECGITTGLERTIYKFYLSEILKNNLLYAYIENTLNGEKTVEIKFISVNVRRTRENF
jgi:hypothetical protein